MISISSMLNPPRRPVELDIANLLCDKQLPENVRLCDTPSRETAHFSSQRHHVQMEDGDKKKAWHDAPTHRAIPLASLLHDMTDNAPSTKKQRRAGPHKIAHSESKITKLGTRRRTTAWQAELLNNVFQHTIFPSSKLRAELGEQLGMSARAVQIWFQNKRQAARLRERRHSERRVQTQPFQHYCLLQSPGSTSSADPM